MSKSTFFPLYCFMNPIYSLTSLKILIMVGFFFFWFSSAPYNFLYFSLFPIFVFILKAFLKCLVILGYQFTFENEAPKNYSMLYICGRLKIATDRSRITLRIFAQATGKMEFHSLRQKTTRGTRWGGEWRW